MNNFNQSSTGVNLELSCFYDMDLSRIYFDDEIKKDENSSFYLFENFDYDLLDIGNYKCTKKDLLNCCSMLNIFSEDSQIVTGRTLSQCNKKDLFECIENYHGDGLVYFLIDKLIPKFDCMVSRGYSQGDKINVIIPHNSEYKPSQKHIDRLFWDSLIFCELEINDREFNFLEFMKDSYKWDRNEIVKIFSNNFEHDKKDYIVEWLSSNLPEYPEYL